MKNLTKLLSLALSLWLMLTLCAIDTLAADTLCVADCNADDDFITIDFSHAVNVDSLKNGTKLYLNGAEQDFVVKYSAHDYVSSHLADASLIEKNTYTITPSGGMALGEGNVYTLVLTDVTASDENILPLKNHKKVFWVELLDDVLGEVYNVKDTNETIPTPWRNKYDIGRSTFTYNQENNSITTNDNFKLKTDLLDGEISVKGEDGRYYVYQQDATTGNPTGDPYQYIETDDGGEKTFYLILNGEPTRYKATLDTEKKPQNINWFARHLIKDGDNYTVYNDDNRNYTIKADFTFDASDMMEPYCVNLYFGVISHAQSVGTNFESTYVKKNATSTYFRVHYRLWDGQTSLTLGNNVLGTLTNKTATAKKTDEELSLNPLAEALGEVKSGAPITLKLAYKDGEAAAYLNGGKIADAVYAENPGYPAFVAYTQRTGSGYKKDQICGVNVPITISNYRLTLMHEITDVSASALTVNGGEATATLKNITDADKTVTAICALYDADGNIRTVCPPQTVNVTAKGETGIEFTTVNSADMEVRLFLIDGDTLLEYK